MSVLESRSAFSTAEDIAAEEGTTVAAIWKLARAVVSRTQGIRRTGICAFAAITWRRGASCGLWKRWTETGVSRRVYFCRACRTDFASVSAFDRHRVGQHAYTYAEDRPDGRRCVAPDEMRAVGMELNAPGRWSILEDAERLRERFQRAA